MTDISDSTLEGYAPVLGLKKSTLKAVKNKPLEIIRNILMGKRYFELKNIDDQVRYMTLNSILMVALLPLVILGITLLYADIVRSVTDLGLALVIIICLILLRSKIPFNLIPIAPVSIFGIYCVYLLSQGTLYLWTAVWIFTFPVIAIFLCQRVVGITQSLAVLIGCIVVMYTPLAQFYILTQIRVRIIIAYVLILSLTIIYQHISTLKDQKEAKLNSELAHEREQIQTMKDNIQQGVFLMDTELKILPQYSKPLISILAYYDSELSGKSFLDILSASLDAKQLQTMKGYFSMVFSKTRSAKVLESANPISEFEYNIDDKTKTLSTKFHLIEQSNEPVIIGIIQDITREKEFEKELQAQREAQELEMKNLFDVIQIDPMVFQDFIEDMEANFNYINDILKDRTLTEKQVITKFYQNVHAIKSNALILGLETFGKKLHALEDDIKAVSSRDEINVDDILSLALKLETLMQEKDSYLSIVNKIESFRSSNQIDSVFIHSLTKAVEKTSAETQKKVEFKARQLDMGILESKLRKPIKDILFQCVRNSVYHGIEPVEDRVRKHKKPQGLLVVTIKRIDNKAEVTFSDDGRGLDWDKLKRKYLEKHPEAREVSKKVLLASIFTPEFSTAAETSTVAGRGVGLSLVKDLVKENNGAIQVDSSESGLTFRFSFPMAS